MAFVSPQLEFPLIFYEENKVTVSVALTRRVQPSSGSVRPLSPDLGKLLCSPLSLDQNGFRFASIRVSVEILQKKQDARNCHDRITAPGAGGSNRVTTPGAGGSNRVTTPGAGGSDCVTAPSGSDLITVPGAGHSDRVTAPGAASATVSQPRAAAAATASRPRAQAAGTMSQSWAPAAATMSRFSSPGELDLIPTCPT
ncbi:hypothetical protein Rs2_43948 [Raphanus sativus]|nr:hypothetical protein Rs2_43948 [Raphanus sativus]